MFIQGTSCVLTAAEQDSTGTACSDYYFNPGNFLTCKFCSPGFLCTASKTKPTDDMCTNVNVCPPLAITQLSCPKSTYNPLTGLMHTSQCTICPLGYHCASGGGSTPTGNCLSGEFCPYGSTSTASNFVCLGGSYSSGSAIGTNADCTFCTLGTYCQFGFKFLLSIGFFSSDLLSVSGCPFGTYASVTTYDNVADCLPCTNYGYCPRQSGLPTLCNLGWYNPSSTNQECIICSGGLICPGSSWSSTFSCSAGYFCPRGTYYDKTFMMNAGFYMSITNANSEYQAVECAAGYSCNAGSISLTGACAAGFFCLQGAPLPNYFACPPGTFSPAINNVDNTGCGPCTAGSSCMTGSGAVSACMAGFYCPAGTQRPDQFGCFDGTYSASTSLTASSGCTTCEAGYYCPQPTALHYSCPEGTYLGTTGAQSITNCQSCTQGNYCGSPASTSPTNCGAGYYCDTGATAPLTCIAGYYCSSATTTSSQMYTNSCPAGFLCPYGVGVVPSSVTTYDCVAGYYCLLKASYVIPCPPGTYRSNTRGTQLADCSITPAGNYLDTFAATTSGTICPQGYYCPIGTTQPISCPYGTFNSVTGRSSSSDCLACTAGYYCPYEATVNPTVCPQGSYCVSGVSSPTLCPVGTYGPTTGLISSSACTKCDAGSYCDTPGLIAVKGPCSAGYYCLLASITATPVNQTYGYLCPAGSYCPEGCTTPQSCSPGTFNNYEGESTSAGCIVCPVGFYCASTINPFPSGPCAAGYYCLAQQTSATPASGIPPAGTFAPGGTPAPIPCPAGTFQGSSGQSSCSACTAGYYCPTTNMSTPIECPTGYYCPTGSLAPLPCIPGTFRDTTRATALSDCTLCTAGNYCGNYGLSAVSNPCAAGYYCQLGSMYQYPSTAVSGASVYGPCPAGYYCPQGTTSSTANACPAGSYNPAQLGTSSSACLKCTAGRYCAGTANTNDSSICPAGYFCPEETSDYTLNPCTPGFFCAAGSDYQKPCLPGTYSDTAQQSSCTNCPAGSYCPRGSSSITPCPVGYYCLANTIYSTQYGCPPGYYNPTPSGTSNSSCLACPASKYCSTAGISSVTSLICAAGFYCSGSAIVSMPMPSSGYGGVCVRGQFCPADSSAPTSCTGGKYCAKSQLSVESGDCTEGYYCTLASTVPTPNDGVMGNICPAGYYCPVGTTVQIACGLGTYLPYTGAVSVSECIECPPGYYCNSLGISFPTTVCPVGYICASGVSDYTVTGCPTGSYCPVGSFESIFCPAGSYQDTPNQGSCKSCPAGSYCELGATSATSCPAGYYCLVNTGYRYSHPCPAGTFNSQSGMTSQNNCTTCTPGYYCADDGLSAVSGPCASGYYCLGGAIVPNPPDGSSTGMACAAGTFCASASTIYTICTIGSFCIQQGLGAVNGSCFAGFYCNAGSSTPVPTDGVMGNICPAGTYCQSNTGAPSDCLSGTYGGGLGLTQQSDCTNCPYGYYCGTSGLSTPSGQCLAGYYCGGSSTTSNSISCTPGHYCPTGSFEAIPCDIGYYQDSATQSTCLQCLAGFYCDFAVSVGIQCELGHYCPAGTRSSTEYPCPAGSYSNALGLSVCIPCPPGFVCPPGSSDSSTQCPYYSYCAQGTGTAPICPAGSYNTGNLGVTSSSGCNNCPAGSYCVDGRISAQCAAGYLCTGSSPTPIPTGSQLYGSQCPAGSYCPAGTGSAIACPLGKFNKLLGGRSITDCTDCSPGYYCVSGVPEPFDCPQGNYCPQAVQAPTPCPAQTYNPTTNQFSLNGCLVCPAGYLCLLTGLSSYLSYPCNTIGSYCVAGAETPTPCPPGTYGLSTTAASISDCLICPSGSYCPGSSSTIITCSEGTYCPSGSAYPNLCLIGHYCPTGSGQSITCPAGFYCPKYNITSLPTYANYTGVYYNLTYNNTAYLPCPTGYVCPEGSFAPTYCQPGQYAKDNLCTNCSVGYYSNSTLGCFKCDPGYICVTGAIRPDPSDLVTQGGYTCPAGYYCPAGASSPNPCLPGYFNAGEGSYSADSCIQCPANTYTNTYGNPSCLPCGPSGYSILGNTTCSCYGKFRNYLISDGTCRCFNRYQFLVQGIYTSDQDGTEDCFPIVYPFLPDGMVRAPNGETKSINDCSKECQNSSGSRIPGPNICQCDNVKSLDDICNKNCRTSSDKVTVQNNQITVSSGSSGRRLIGTGDLGSLNTYYGYLNCSDSPCTVYSMNMNEYPEAVYGSGDAIQSILGSSRRRLATSSTGITNPVICIKLTDTYIFSVSTYHYPVYLKDSLLNTNPDFDYGPFLNLASMMASPSSNITIFAFTFSTQGIYNFADSNNSDSHIIIGVMGDGQQCPDPDVPIRTRTTSSVLTMGTKIDSDIITDPDWVFIGTTILWLLLAVALVLFGVYFFENMQWIYRFRLKSDYRKKHIGLDVTNLTKPENDSSSVEESSDKEKPKENKNKEEEIDSVDLMANDDIDPTIFQNMLRVLNDQDALAKSTFSKRSEQGVENMKNMLERLNKLKKYLRESLAGLNDNKKDSESEVEIEISPDQEIDKALAGIADNFARDVSRFDEAKQKLIDMLNDPNLSEKDKRDLLADFNGNMDRIDQALGEEQRKAQEILSKRLLDRKNRKKSKKVTNEEEKESSFIQKTEIISEKEPESIEQGKQAIAKQIDDEKNDIIKKMRNELNLKLKETKDEREKKNLMEDYNKKAKELELKMQQSKEKQEAELLQRLKNRKGRGQKPKESEIELAPAVPVFFQIEDQEKINVLQEKHEEERQKLYEKQEAEKIQALEEVEKQEILLPKPEEKQKLEEALKSALNESERQELLNQLNQLNEKLSSSAVQQQTQLEAKLLERKRLRALKEAELKKKHIQEQEKLDDNEDKELGALTDDITKQRINKLISSNLSPEEIVKNIKQMIDEKHELELNQLIAKKQEILAERQTYLLQESLGVKAVEIQQARKDFFNKRSQVETSALHPSAKFAELQSLEKKESEKMTEINYNFINNLSNQQDSM